MKKFVRKLCIILTLILVWLTVTSCRASKSERSNLNIKEEAKQDTNIKTKQETELRTELEKLIEKALSEHLNITEKKVEYDTDKPILPETGKPPIKQETETVLSKKTEDKSKGRETVQSIETDQIVSEDRTETATKGEVVSATVNESDMQKESDIFLKWVGGITLFVVIGAILVYALCKWLRSKISV